MKTTRLHHILFAVVAVLIASLACNAISPTPGASNFYMATDSEGTNRTTVFSPTDDFFIFFEVAGIEVGTKFQSRWYALDIEGVDPSTPVQTIDYVSEPNIRSIYFQLSPLDSWSPGNYKVEIYMNDVKIGEQQFSVQ